MAVPAASGQGVETRPPPLVTQSATTAPLPIGSAARALERLRDDQSKAMPVEASLAPGKPEHTRDGIPRVQVSSGVAAARYAYVLGWRRGTDALELLFPIGDAGAVSMVEGGGVRELPAQQWRGSTLSAGDWQLVIAAVLASAIAIYFYLRVVVLMFFADPVGEGPTVALPSPLTASVIVIGVAATFILGIVPGPLLDLLGRVGVFIR